MADASIVVNGRPHPLPAGGNLVQLLSQLRVDHGNAGVAVAINGEVVPRPDWAARRLVPGDHVEVVRAVQGG
jgi:sulfur carrier protein